MSQNIMGTDEAKKASISDLNRILSSSNRGISAQEAEKRLKQYGYNEIAEKKIGFPT